MAGETERPQALRAAMAMLFEYEKSLASQLISGLRDIDGVVVQGITSPDAMDRRVPTVSFTHGAVAPGIIAESLAKENIFVWSGHNYAVEVARTLGIFESGGALRVGPVHYNTIAEIDEFLAALGRIIVA
jgi:selenocysteine lyase/cysteine desulfurase